MKTIIVIGNGGSPCEGLKLMVSNLEGLGYKIIFFEDEFALFEVDIEEDYPMMFWRED